MHASRRSVLVLAAAAFVSAVAVGAATSGPGTSTYHGSFSGPVVYAGCATQPPLTVAAGRWNVALHGTTDATVSFNIFTNGKHHVSYGGTFAQIVPSAGETFAVEIPTEAGTLRISLAGDEFTYQIAPYNLLGISCASVTYSGTV